MSIWCIGAAVADIVATPINDSSTWKEKQRIDHIEIQIGGDAANQSQRLADLGLSVSLIAGIGTDNNGILLQEALSKRGVNTSNLAVKSYISTGTSLVLVSSDGSRHTFSVHGAHSELSFDDLPKWEDVSSVPQAISLASLFSMPKLEKEGMKEFLAEAHSRGILIFADLAFDKFHLGLDGISDFLPYIDYFLPSEYDALEMTKASNIIDAANVYHKMGAKHVIIKCGERGVYYSSCSSEESSSKITSCGQVAAPTVTPLDTTGAGDCMVALFISRILAGDSIPDACLFACHGASISTLYLGASLHKLTADELNEKTESGR